MEPQLFRGWGCTGVLGSRRIHTRYRPGVVEVSHLLGGAISLCIAVGSWSAGLLLHTHEQHLLALVLQASTAVPALFGLDAAEHLLTSLVQCTDCRILLRRGWVEIGPCAVRDLDQAEIVERIVGLGPWKAFAKVCLRFPDGTIVPLFQGPCDQLARRTLMLRELLATRARAPSSCR